MATKAKAVFLTAITTITLGGTCVAVTGTAIADPVPAGTIRPYSGVGSDTTQSVLNALAGDVPGTAGVLTNVASYDAVGSATIRTKPSGPDFTRPNGSGDGVLALSDSLNGTPYKGFDITGKLAFARSSGGPSTVVPNGPLTYVPFARDAVAYAYIDASGSLAALTRAQLTDIYSSNSPVVIGGVTVKPFLPQSNSGTRKFFLKAISVTTIGTSVTQSSGEENTGTVITEEGSIIPFSSAAWVAQFNGVIPSTISGVKLGAPGGIAPVTPVATKVQPNAAFYNDSSFGRDVFNVLPTDAISGPNQNPALVATFVATPGKKLKLNTAQAQSDIRKFGFLTVTYNGDLTSTHTLQGPLTS